MPKRSNRFQKITHRIYKALSGPGIKVEESVLVKEKNSDAEREIDILISSTIASHTLRVAIECSDHHRDQDITWVDSLIGKYDNLDIQKIIAISHSDFSKTAKQKAVQHNIELITLKEAEEIDWAKKLGPSLIKFFGFHNRPLIVGISSGSQEFLKIEYTFEGEIKNEEPSEIAIAQFFLGYYKNNLSNFASNELVKFVFSNWKMIIDRGNKPAYWELKYKCPNTTLELANFNVKLDFDGLVWGFGTKFTAEELAPEKWVLGDNIATLVKAKMYEKGPLHITLVADSGGNLKGVDISPK